MSLPLLLFILLAVLVVLLLGWAVKPPKRHLLSQEDVLEALSEERHYARLPQILQSLREEDTDFLRSRGHAELVSRLRAERKRIALRYLDYLQEEYQVLLDVSRMLATMAPELSAVGEFERLKMSLRFILLCRYQGWRLRLGLQPWDVFGSISDMAGDMTLRIEMATARLGESALAADDSTLFQKEGRGGRGSGLGRP